MDKRRPALIAAGGIAIVAVLLVALWVRSRAAETAGSRGMVHHANLRYDEALADYARAASLSDDWRWIYYSALVHFERGQAAEAAHALRAVVAGRPDFGLAWWRLGEAEFKQAHYDEADRAYARAQADPSVVSYAERSRARIRTGHAPSARTYTPPRDPMVDALADLSHSSVFLIRQAAAIDLSADPARRERLVRRALEVDPDNPDVVYAVGALLQQLRHPADALPYFARHLDMVEDDQQTLVQMGKCYSDLGRLEEAEQTLRSALHISDDAVGFYNLGYVMEQRGRRAEAEDSYRRALATDPSHASARNNLAALLAETGRLDEAAKHLAMVIRLNPSHADAHANLGAALAQQGKFAEALRHFDEALRIDPNHAAARANRDAVINSQIPTPKSQK